MKCLEFKCVRVNLHCSRCGHIYRIFYRREETEQTTLLRKRSTLGVRSRQDITENATFGTRSLEVTYINFESHRR